MNTLALFGRQTSRVVVVLTLGIATAAGTSGCPAERAAVVGQKCVSDGDCGGPYICRQTAGDGERICLVGFRELEVNPEPDVAPGVEPAVEPGVEPAVEPGVEPDVQPVVEPEPAIEPDMLPEPEPEPVCDEEFFIDATGFCTRTRIFPPLDEGRLGHTATRLNDSEFLVAGGLTEDQQTPPTTYVYNGFGAVRNGPLIDGGYGSTAARIANGRVLIVGGLTVTDDFAEFLDIGEVDTQADTFTFVAPLATHRYLHGMVPAIYGETTSFHIVGGATEDLNATSAETFAVGGGSTTFANQPLLGFNPMIAKLTENTSFVMGGSNTNDPQVGVLGTYFIATQGVLSPLAAHPEPVHEAGIALSADGTEIIVAGGLSIPGGERTSAIWRYQIALNTWVFGGDLSSARSNFSLHVEPTTGRLLSIGGLLDGGVVATVEVVQMIEPGLALNTVITSLSEGRYDAKVVSFGPESVAIVGGLRNQGFSSAVDVIDVRFP